MVSSLELHDEARRILRLARADRRAAAIALGTLSVDAQAALLTETPLAGRAELLALMPEPELVIPRLPEAELCFTLRAVGLNDSGWILGYATSDQMVACVDLDAWKAGAPDPTLLGEWLDGFIQGGRESLLRAARALDLELLVLMFQDRMEVELKPNDDSWVPPEGTSTLDGQFYFRARREDDPLEDLQELLRALFEEEYWLYFRLLQGVNWEISSETHEWSRRWRLGRLEDLGFPPPEEALEVYAWIPPGKRTLVPEASTALFSEIDPLPVPLLQLPAKTIGGYALFQAVEKLEENERRSFFQAFVSLANHVAVADDLPLGDPDSLPLAIDKAARLASGGLDFVAAENGLESSAVLRRVGVRQLFRVGANLLRDEESK